jgi:hypothetical protein
MSDLWPALGTFALAIGSILRDIGLIIWELLVDYPQLRTAVIIAAIAFVIVWFVHGAFIRDQKPCRVCKGRGKHFAKYIWKKTFTMCDACGGSGRRMRMAARIRERWRRP